MLLWYKSGYHTVYVAFQHHLNRIEPNNVSSITLQQLLLRRSAIDQDFVALILRVYNCTILKGSLTKFIHLCTWQAIIFSIFNEQHEVYNPLLRLNVCAVLHMLPSHKTLQIFESMIGYLYQQPIQRIRLQYIFNTVYLLHARLKITQNKLFNKIV